MVQRERFYRILKVTPDRKSVDIFGKVPSYPWGCKQEEKQENDVLLLRKEKFGLSLHVASLSVQLKAAQEAGCKPKRST